jgi:hypothetical protein
VSISTARTLFVNNAIVIKTAEETYTFRSFIARDKFYHLVEAQRKEYISGSLSPSSSSSELDSGSIAESKINSHLLR